MNEAVQVHERAKLQVFETQESKSLPVGIDLGAPTLVVSDIRPEWFALLRSGRAWLKRNQAEDREIRELASRAAILGLSLEAETLPNEDLRAGTALRGIDAGLGSSATFGGRFHHISGGMTGNGERPAMDLAEPDQPKLTEREMEVLQLLSEGWSNHEIGRFSKLSLGTVKFHLAHIFEKLGAANRAEAVRRAAESGLLQF